MDEFSVAWNEKLSNHKNIDWLKNRYSELRPFIKISAPVMACGCGKCGHVDSESGMLFDALGHIKSCEDEGYPTFPYIEGPAYADFMAVCIDIAILTMEPDQGERDGKENL